MNSLLIHGVYDLPTFQTLSQIGIAQFGFDMRGRSRNFIPFKDLNFLLSRLIVPRAFLIFEDDKKETIFSFLNILKDAPIKLILEFRDNQDAQFYQSIDHDFVWMYRPGSDWKKILSCEKLVGIILPYQWREHYQDMSLLWETIEKRNLEVFIHAENLEEAISIPHAQDIKLSIDLTLEVEKGFRDVDQDLLKKSPLWSNYHENFTRQ